LLLVLATQLAQREIFTLNFPGTALHWLLLGVASTSPRRWAIWPSRR
jgi:hypothetical protein